MKNVHIQILDIFQHILPDVWHFGGEIYENVMYFYGIFMVELVELNNFELHF